MQVKKGRVHLYLSASYTYSQPFGEQKKGTVESPTLNSQYRYSHRIENRLNVNFQGEKNL